VAVTDAGTRPSAIAEGKVTLDLYLEFPAPSADEKTNSTSGIPALCGAMILPRDRAGCIIPSDETRARYYDLDIVKIDEASDEASD